MAKYKNFPFSLPENKSVNLKEEDFGAKENKSASYKRSTIITIICGYFFISWSLSLIAYLRLLFKVKDVSFNFTSFSSLEGFVSFLISTLIFISIFGLWFVRKWAVYLYTAVNIFSFIYLLLKFNSYGYLSWDVFSTALWASILPIFVIAIGFMNINKMK